MPEAGWEEQLPYYEPSLDQLPDFNWEDWMFPLMVAGAGVSPVMVTGFGVYTQNHPVDGDCLSIIEADAGLSESQARAIAVTFNRAHELGLLDKLWGRE